MKRATFILLIAVLILGCIGLVACGGKDGVTTQEPAETPSARPPSGDTGNWGVPIYPKNNPDSMFYVKGDQNQLLKNKPAVAEMRSFTTSDKVDTVAAFYNEKMTAGGWKELMWGEVEGTYLGEYDKNDGQEYAQVSISDDGDETYIQIQWLYVK